MRVPVAALVTCLLVTGCSGGSEGTRGGRTPKEGASSAAGKGVPRIWVLAVGVSDYKDTSLALEYADRDATAVDAFFASDAGGRVPDERRVLLTNENATRAAVLTGLNTLSRRTAPDDMIVIFLAMHGLPDPGGDLSYLSFDTDAKALVGTGLPQRDIEYAISRAPARRVVLLADACHAGAAGFAGFQGKRAAALAETNRLVGQLAESKPGTAVLTASSATEASAEGKKWGGGHGVFTHHLLGGLAGGADEDADGFITIRELFDFTYRNVSKDTSGDQHPELKGRFDNAMPLAALPGARGGARVAARRSGGRGGSDADPNTPLKATETGKNAAALDKSCEKGEQDACARLGSMFLIGDGVTLDPRNGARMLGQACEKGSARGCCTLLAHYYDPDDTRPETQAPACNDACDGGFGPACRAIERMRRAGGPRASDPKAAARSKLARDLDESACHAGDAEACHGLAEMLLADGDAGDAVRAKKLLVRACGAGLARACEAAARASGFGSADGRELLEKGCEAGFGRACASLATVFYEDGARSPNPRQAFAYHNRACDMGVTGSCRSCAEKAQADGRSAFAIPCLQRGCNGGDGPSCMTLGTMYETGEGTPANAQLAIGMYSRACALRHRPACSKRDALQSGGGKP